MADPVDPNLLNTERELERECERLQKAEGIVGHVFVDKTRLLTALTHRSYLNEHKTSVAHNEVLEFLGDAVLGLVVAEALVMTSSPGTTEGALSERRAAHVSAENLAKASSTSGLQALLRTGRGLRSGPKNDGGVVDNLAADVVEAVIGAVFSDAGLVAAKAVVFRLLGDPPQSVTTTTANHKRVLQERLERLFGKAPEYAVTRKDGPNHAPVYEGVALFAGVELGRGTGKNKRAAAEDAAAHAVKDLESVDDKALKARLGLK